VGFGPPVTITGVLKPAIRIALVSGLENFILPVDLVKQVMQPSQNEIFQTRHQSPLRFGTGGT
jgi:hypothetical protein